MTRIRPRAVIGSAHDAEVVLEQMRSRNRVDSLFPALRHGKLCVDCQARPAVVNSRCGRCDERRTLDMLDAALNENEVGS